MRKVVKRKVAISLILDNSEFISLLKGEKISQDFMLKEITDIELDNFAENFGNEYEIELKLASEAVTYLKYMNAYLEQRKREFHENQPT
jgi:hypothetical protein